jgi:bacillithiol biosynthesis deacetylase BshB1
VIRSLCPRICLIPYWEDRHPDHQTAARLLERAIFDAGLIKIKTEQKAYRPEIILYYMLHQPFTPSFIVDISEEMEFKMAAIRAYVSQFSDFSKGAQSTYINNANFLDTIQTRAEFFGQQIGSKFGEGYYYKGMLKINNILQFFS